MPELYDITEPRILQNISVAYRNEEYVALQVMPAVRVSRESDKYYVYGKEAFKPVSTLRADGTPANAASYTLTTDIYSCEEHALVDNITQRMKDNAEAVLNLEIDTTELLTDKILLGLEIAVSDRLRSAANYNSSHVLTLSGGSQWNDFTNSNPLMDIDITAKRIIQRDGGRVPNTMVVPFEVAQTLANHPKIVDLIKYTDPSLLTRSGLPKIFRGLNVLEANSSKDVSLSSTPSMANIWGKDVVICYVDPRPGLKKFSFGYTFMTPVTGPERKVRKWVDNEINATKIEVSMIYTNKIVAKDAGFVIKAAVA